MKNINEGVSRQPVSLNSRIKVWVGASLHAAPPVRIAKSRQFSMAQWTQKRETRSRNSRAQDNEGRRGSRNDARKMHREKPAFNAGEWKKGNRGIPRGTEHTKKGRTVDVRNANEMRTVEEANKRLIVQRCPTKWKDTPARKAAWRVCKG